MGEYTGPPDMFAELQAMQRQLAEITQGAFGVLVSAQSGNITTTSQPAVALTSGPTLKVPPGKYIFTLSLFMETTAEGLTAMEGYLSGAKLTIRPCRFVARNTFDGGTVTGQIVATVVDADTFSVFVATSGKISATFASAVISAQPIAR